MATHDDSSNDYTSTFVLLVAYDGALTCDGTAMMQTMQKGEKSSKVNCANGCT